MGFLTKNRILNFEFLIFNLLLLTCVSCTHVSTPRPYAYFRIDLPDTSYTNFPASLLSPSMGEPEGAFPASLLSPFMGEPEGAFPASLLSPSMGEPEGAFPASHLSPFMGELEGAPYTFSLSRNAIVQPVTSEPFWINIYYPAFDATIHCSYKPVQHNLRELTNDALDLVYRNANFASAIPEQSYYNPDHKVYGVLFDLEGNTASSCQFFLTDSTHHFFRASVYCNCHPNADSLAPVYQYLRTDVIRMIESFQWTR